ncbi:CCA tRNA nucleotidyltransferase [Caminibacter mediatlanticus]|uniref:RNA nucleotidyltransferase n=1 Tax=Caminibacter mediatlanticus TB-2 TaxID=391592 RepID=A0AAI9AHW7_9BACT|nr:CCA tRNA nucleotidyltransferase [Caminibacter mediatlanticus]EDM23926.1 putative RNA nucleotidyltransferase [Caminibacter mediatlanticus TB-2]
MKNSNPDLEFLKNFFAPFTKRVYLVGGCVRDEFLGITPNEFDLEVYDISPQKFDKLMKKLGAKGVGKSFFVYKWKNFDIALPRKETKIAKGHRGFEVEIIQDEKLASKRRDFTMNALMENIYTNEILDFWGGMKDIKNKIIRHIDDKTFIEDSLRVLRAMQFASRLHFKIHKKTIEHCKKIDLNDLSKDRIYMEFEKMFKSKFLYYGFYYFIVLDIAKKLLNLEFNKKEFFHLAKLYKNNPIESFFLYHLIYYKNLNHEKVIKALNLPNRLKKEIKIKKCPKLVTNRFLFGLALKYPLKTFSILNLNCCREWIIKNNLWDKKYKPKHIDPKNPRKSIIKEIRSYDKILIKKA